VENSGLSWTPDYGNWPAARGVYGNGGLARETATWINNFLTGTTRIEAEDFDWGGNGVSYYDTDSVNVGGQYRPMKEWILRKLQTQAAVTMSDGFRKENGLNIP